MALSVYGAMDRSVAGLQTKNINLCVTVSRTACNGRLFDFMADRLPGAAVVICGWG